MIGLALCVAAAAGCTPQPGPPTLTMHPPAEPSTAQIPTPAVTCDVAPTSLVGQTLRLTVDSVRQTVLPTGVGCRYNAQSPVQIRFRTNVTPTDFADNRRELEASGSQISSIRDLGDDAYAVARAEQGTIATFATLTEGIEITLIAKCSVDDARTLLLKISQQLPR